MKVTVLGTGYVGLVSGVGLAAKGHDVTCLDVRNDIVERLNRGEPSIHEAGLPELLTRVRRDGRFKAALASAEAMIDSDVILIAVGTPSAEGNIDLSYVEAAATSIGNYLRTVPRFTSVIVKSTVVPGTTDTFVRGLLEQHSGLRLGQFGLGMNPEFLREGEAISDFMEPDRIVFGHDDPRTLEMLGELYAPWDCDKIAVNTRTAEMIKYANNCLLATQISAVNEIANIAAALGGIDALDVMRGIHADKRWNPIAADGSRVNPAILTYLVPGCGFGGSCFPKDVQAMRSHGRSLSVNTRLLQAVLDINEDQPLQVTTLLERSLGSPAGKRVLVLGLAFKPGTDDVRESPAVNIVRRLAMMGAKVEVHDPIAADQARAALHDVDVTFVEGWSERLEAADAVIVATTWPEYTALADPANLLKLRGKTIVDPRRLFTGDEFAESEYLTIGVGRRPADVGTRELRLTDESGDSVMKREPLVSILMNCYNGEKYLRETLDSVVAQTYQNWEIVFWDNQSTDRSAEIFTGYNDRRLKYYLAPEHSAVGVARAAAWKHLAGEFVAVLDTDDLWFPQKLERQIPLFDDPEVGIVISDTLFFNERAEKPLYAGKYPPTGWVFERLLERYFVSLETVVFRKATAQRLARAFDPDFSAIADFDMVVRMSLISKLALYPEILAKWRVHPGSFTWKYPQSFLEEKERWMAKQLAEGTFSAAKYADSIRRFHSKNMRTKAFFELLQKRRRAALKTLLGSGLDHVQAWGLLVFCFLPFSSIAMSYVYKRRSELTASAYIRLRLVLSKVRGELRSARHEPSGGR